MAIFSLNILIDMGNVTLLFIIFAGSVDQRQKTNEIVDATGLTFQFASQLCAILSCFIFSKVAYSVKNTCTQKLPELFGEIEQVSTFILMDEMVLMDLFVLTEVWNGSGRKGT